MRIFVEGSALLKERSGVGQFAKRLIEAYAQKHPDDQIVITGFKFFTQGEYQRPIKASQNIRYRVIRWFPGRIYNQLFKIGLAPPFDILFGGRRNDIFLFPNFVRFPLLFNKKSLVVIHDLSFIYFSQFTHPKNLPYMLKFVPKSIRGADQILTISASSKRQIINRYKVPTSKISIVTPAVDTSLFFRRKEDEISKIRKKYNLPEAYILYTGTVEPRKNITGLLDAYTKLGKEFQQKYSLVLAGGKGWHDEEILAKINQLHAEGLSITQTGYVPDDDLPAIYSGAEIFVFPSFYEGFGIPLLEAMACGVPVISANNTSIPEVIGDAGIMIDAEDNEALISAITRLLGSGALRDKYIAEGYKQIKKFSWEKSAEQLKSVLDKI